MEKWYNTPKYIRSDFMATWTPIENAKIVGILPDYRDLLKQGQDSIPASKKCAVKLMNDDHLKIFSARVSKVKDAENTIAQHIRRMDDIVSGNATPEHADEFAWENCYKY
jgi:hypothetical protein